jgi:preprotein translocase SecE subunit
LPALERGLMARQTRAERRARRLAQADLEPAVAGAGGRGADKPPVRLAPEPGPRPGPRPALQTRWGGGVVGFIRESIGELKKVEWPGQNQVVQGTVVVIIACIIIGSYLYLADQAFSKFVSKVLLGQ